MLGGRGSNRSGSVDCRIIVKWKKHGKDSRNLYARKARNDFPVTSASAPGTLLAVRQPLQMLIFRSSEDVSPRNEFHIILAKGRAGAKLGTADEEMKRVERRSLQVWWVGDRRSAPDVEGCKQE